MTKQQPDSRRNNDEMHQDNMQMKRSDLSGYVDKEVEEEIEEAMDDPWIKQKEHMSRLLQIDHYFIHQVSECKRINLTQLLKKPLRKTYFNRKNTQSEQITLDNYPYHLEASRLDRRVDLTHHLASNSIQNLTLGQTILTNSNYSALKNDLNQQSQVNIRRNKKERSLMRQINANTTTHSPLHTLVRSVEQLSLNNSSLP